MKIGILGAGQLGRMLAIAGNSLGHEFGFLGRKNTETKTLIGQIFDSNENSNATDSLVDFADVISYESENTDAQLVQEINQKVAVYPGEVSLFTAQHRGREKALFTKLGIPCAPYQLVHSFDQLQLAVTKIGLPAILKTTTEGYDGKGQCVIDTDTVLAEAWKNMHGAECILEGFVNFQRELSLIAVRDQHNNHAYYPLVENTHHEGILRLTIAPAQSIDSKVQKTAEHYMESLLDEMNHVGALTLELFQTNDGLVANEMAPRVHNSGHWTIDGAITSQFENHIRAITKMPLGNTESKYPYCAMINIIGKTGPVEMLNKMPNTHLHLYDKSERDGRKLGHINITAKSELELKKNIESLSVFLPKSWRNDKY